MSNNLNFAPINIPRTEKQLFTVREVAAIFQVTPQRVTIWIRNNDLAATKRKKEWIITRTALVEYANKRFGS